MILSMGRFIDGTDLILFPMPRLNKNLPREDGRSTKDNGKSSPIDLRTAIVTKMAQVVTATRTSYFQIRLHILFVLVFPERRSYKAFHEELMNRRQLKFRQSSSDGSESDD
ncbi:hypothetical protein PoB_001747100 [Plakobranchus ocellatus]|uniref:Uncharacterized protein n=1 Tax=Plakobranchus ocellatus TaxID=259542 RepID=A0AAV3YV42_9GAST|nr:hypothetical protein PoB_001747100 [Plakobranchus ocellatus]